MCDHHRGRPGDQKALAGTHRCVVCVSGNKPGHVSLKCLQHVCWKAEELRLIARDISQFRPVRIIPFRPGTLAVAMTMVTP